MTQREKTDEENSHAHGHDHSHSHAGHVHGATSGPMLWVSLIITVLFVIGEAIAGYLAHSLALMLGPLNALASSKGATIALRSSNSNVTVVSSTKRIVSGHDGSVGKILACPHVTVAQTTGT